MSGWMLHTGLLEKPLVQTCVICLNRSNYPSDLKMVFLGSDSVISPKAEDCSMTHRLLSSFQPHVYVSPYSCIISVSRVETSRRGKNVPFSRLKGPELQLWSHYDIIGARCTTLQFCNRRDVTNHHHHHHLAFSSSFPRRSPPSFT